MSHLLDPTQIANDAAYAAARRELDDLLAGEPLEPAGTRALELVHLIDEFEARRDGYDLAQMRRLLGDG